MFLPLSSIFMYLAATPSSRCIMEGEGVLAANHIIVCGVKEKTDQKWIIKSYCLQTSAIKSDPHEINGSFSITSAGEVKINKFTCSCKAGISESCKHVAATLLFCSRKPLEQLEDLSCTDTECLWKVHKTKVVNEYLPQPLKKTHCFKSTRKNCNNKRSFSKEEVANMFSVATEALPNSSFAQHRRGRRENIEISNIPGNIPSRIPSHVRDIFNNSVESSFLENLDLNIPVLSNCCKMVVESFRKDNVLESMCIKQGTLEWKRLRKNKITGSTCYSVFTFKKQDWTKMLINFFNPKSVSTKEMRHGSEQEPFALEAFRNMNPNLDVKTIGIKICHKYPWLAYSPDGIVFEHGNPTSLIEIKCPFLGKIKPGREVLKSLKYLNPDCTLKQNHSYYAQIQFGMALLNLRMCEFIIYFSKEKDYSHISIPFDENFTHHLIETVSKKYFEKMIHHICS